MSLRNKTAIVGVGETEYSKNSGRSTLKMAVEASLQACEDAGIKPREIDAIMRFSSDFVWEIDLLRALGLPNLRAFYDISHGGGAGCGTVAAAAAVVHAGMAETVLCFRSLNERSERRYGLAQWGGRVGHWAQYNLPQGLITPAQWVAMFGRRYLHEYGHSTEVLGYVSVLCRARAASNPHAMMYNKPISLQDHQDSRWIAEPLRLLDCTLDTDGAVAFIVTSAERAKKLKGDPVYIAGVAQGTGSQTEMMMSYQRPSLSRLEEADAAAQDVYRMAELTPKDIETAQVYDHFTPMVLMSLESFGFAERGNAPDLFREGALEPDGEMPLNTHGGHLGDGYLHGMSHIIEGVRQIRGTANNQLARMPKTALVTSGTAVPTSALILSKEAY